jgi:hypothetical protein
MGTKKAGAPEDPGRLLLPIALLLFLGYAWNLFGEGATSYEGPLFSPSSPAGSPTTTAHSGPNTDPSDTIHSTR